MQTSSSTGAWCTVQKKKKEKKEKNRLEQCNSKNTFIHPWTAADTTYIPHTHMHAHTHTHHSKSNEVIYRKRWREYRFSQLMLDLNR